jgi:hypothetical protein
MGVSETLRYLHAYSPVASLAAYSLATFLVFTTVWRFYGLKHVALDKGMAEDWPTALYYSATCMLAFTPPGEAPPRDGRARALVTAQAGLSWIVMFWLIGAGR